MKYRLVNNKYESDFMKNLIAERNGKDAERLLHPAATELQDPSYLDNIEAGFAAFKAALGGNILLIVDSDTDGFASAALTYSYIKNVDNATTIIPMIHEGKQHGIVDHVDAILDSGNPFDLIIIPDAGSNEASAHSKLNCPILVLDHHIQDSAPAPNTILINNQSSPNYINKGMPGTGVAWQFFRYCDQKLGTDYANQYINLVALAISSDAMDVSEYENAYILRQGLTQDFKNFFFSTLLDKQAYSLGNPARINSIDIAFYIVPMINALIRVGTMDEKRKLFWAFVDGGIYVDSTKRGHKPDETEMLAEQVARLCVNAKSRQNRVKDKALEELTVVIENNCWQNHKILVVRLNETDVELPPELNGLVAMNIASKYHRPTLVLRKGSDSNWKGSGRGINGDFLFKQYLEESQLVTYAVGHSGAFGTCIPDKNLNALIDKADRDLADVDFSDNCYDVNFVVPATDGRTLNALIDDIDKYHLVYGQHNEEPLIAITDIFLNHDDVSIIGAKLNTLRFTKNNITYILFNALDRIPDFQQYNDMKVTIVGRANMNEWGGKTSPQIIIEDYSIENAEFDF